MKVDTPLPLSHHTTESRSRLKFAGINIGRGHVKLKTDRDYVQYASLIHRAKPFLDDLRLMPSTNQLVVVDGVTYEVGEDVALTGERTSDKNVFSQWATSTPYQVLMQSVIDRLSEESNGPWTVMLGMPVAEYRDEQYRNSIVKMWQRAHKGAHGMVTVLQAMTMPEPVGAFWQCVMSEAHREQEFLEQRVIVVDVGYFTTDVIAVNRMRFNPSIADSINRGMRDVYRSIGEQLTKKYRKQCSDMDIEMAVLNKWPLLHRGVALDIQQEINEAVKQVGDNIMQWLRSAVDQADGLILVCGGGAFLLTDIVKQTFHQAKVEMVMNPQQANAHGYWWMAKTSVEEL